MRTFYLSGIVLVLGIALTGCANSKLMTQKDLELSAKDQQIAELEQEIARLEREAGSERQRADQLNGDLQEALGDLQDKEKLWLRQKEGMSTISMPNTATFDSGSTRLTVEGMAIIDKVWEVLARYPDREILIEGHTDNVPIASEFKDRFATNWELSTARALAVLYYVRDKHNADPKRMSAVGCGEHRPVADNSGLEGRAKNRRVVIVVGGQNGLAAK
ncbi:MAG: OmpA family protein [Candidatus Krumholzibacteria bacterium]|nr:OmpA family protein [Candidatus Krumholzibacteria bacterium]